jgi:hypothetical protein
MYIRAFQIFQKMDSSVQTENFKSRAPQGTNDEKRCFKIILESPW